MSNTIFPPAQPTQTQTGNVEIDLPYRGDFSTQSNGDLVLAFDQPGGPRATEQRIQRLAYTNARVPNGNGGYISSGDDIFNPSYGIGLPSKVGTMFPGYTAGSQQQVSSALSEIQALWTKGLASDPTIAPQPPPSVVVAPDAVIPNQVDINVICTAITGQIITIPARPITGS